MKTIGGSCGNSCSDSSTTRTVTSVERAYPEYLALDEVNCLLYGAVMIVLVGEIMSIDSSVDAGQAEVYTGPTSV